MKSNIFTVFLDNAKLKYTGFSYKYYEEHPYKYSMLGLSMMLNDYGIANKGVRTQTKDEAVKELVPPYIAHINHDFVNGFVRLEQSTHYLIRSAFLVLRSIAANVPVVTNVQRHVKWMSMYVKRLIIRNVYDVVRA